MRARLAQGGCSSIKTTALDAAVLVNCEGRTIFRGGCLLGLSYDSMAAETLYAVKSEIIYGQEYEK